MGNLPVVAGTPAVASSCSGRVPIGTVPSLLLTLPVVDVEALEAVVASSVPRLVPPSVPLCSFGVL